MGLIKFGAFVTDIRKSIGGSTFSRNTYGAYVRNKVTPVNPSTTYQQLVRQYMAQLAQDWSSLSINEKKQLAIIWL